MTTRWTLISVVFVALLFQPLELFARQTSDWAAVKAISVGQAVRVETKAGRKYDGKLEAVSDDKISLRSKDGTVDQVAAGDVKKVHRVGSGSRAPGAAIGAAIGAGIGLGVGGGLLAATGGSDSGGKVVAPFIAAGAGIGALFGALTPKTKRTLVYEAK
ncbi:MAG: hypothetical protein QM785_19075 [Pyrinomonadaceae bacterium]